MKMDLQNAILIVLCLVLLLGVFTLSAQAVDSSSPSSIVSTPLSIQLDDVTFPIVPYDLLFDSGVRKRNSVLLPEIQSYLIPYGSYSFDSGLGTLTLSGNHYTCTYSGVSPALSSDGSTGSSNTVYAFGYRSTDSSDLILLSLSSSYPNNYPGAIPAVSSLSNPSSPFYYLFDNLASSTPDPVSLDYTLPPGNIAYIPLPSGASENITYTLTTTYYMAFGNNDTSRINQVVTVYSTLPSSSNNIAPSSPKIPWTNNGNVNLLGVSANKIYNGSIPFNLGGQYLVVANPLTMPSQGGSIGGDTYINGSITIHVSNVGGNPYIYPMSESLTITVGDGIGSESTYGDDPYTYVTDPDTGEIIWTDPNGGDSAPVSGGNNPLPSPNTIFDWLRNISQQLADFLRGPVQAVQTVVSAIRDFLSSFTQLYMWLPSPVYSLITSALMIALTIGVIKIFV